MSRDLAQVYRCYDASGRLLYIGCSNDVDRRMKQHRASALWFKYLARVEASDHYNRQDALAVEANAIRDERPYFNSQPEHHLSVQANKHEARRRLAALGITRFLFETDDGGDEDDDCECGVSYYTVLRAAEKAIRDEFPVIDDDVRHAAYLMAVTEAKAGAA